jgi:uncharacterized protein (TIGR03086 family)
MDVTALKQACASTERFVARMTADQYELPTPCSEWDVRALLNHLLGVFAVHRALFTDEPPEVNMPPGGLPDVDLVGDQPLAAYRAGVDAVLAVTGGEALATTRQTPLGAMPGEMLCGFTTLDILVHGWDLATATAQDATLEPDLADQVLAFARQAITDNMRAPHIGAEIAVGAAASPTERLVAYLGRTPAPRATRQPPTTTQPTAVTGPDGPH